MVNALDILPRNDEVMSVSPERDVSYPNKFLVDARINDPHDASKKLAQNGHCSHWEPNKLKHKIKLWLFGNI